MNAHKLITHPRTWMLLLIAGVVALPLTMTNVTTADDDEGPLVEAMETINKHYKMLRREARKKEFSEDTIQRLWEMQAAGVPAMHHEPPILAKIPAAEKKQFMIDYKKVNMEMVVHFMKMEVVFAEGKLDEFAEMIDGMGDIKSSSHEKFVEEE